MMPRFLPSQQSSSPTNTVSSQHPSASLRGSMYARPMSASAGRTSHSSTPRKTFIASTLARDEREARMESGIGRRDWSIDSRIARSKEGVRSGGVGRVNGRDKRARRAFKVGTRVGGENDCENSAKESSDIKPRRSEWPETITAVRIDSTKLLLLR